MSSAKRIQYITTNTVKVESISIIPKVSPSTLRFHSLFFPLPTGSRQSRSIFCHCSFIFFRISYKWNHILRNFCVWLSIASMLVKIIPVGMYISNYLCLLLSSPRDGYNATGLSIHKVKNIWVVSDYEYYIQFLVQTCFHFSLINTYKWD